MIGKGFSFTTNHVSKLINREPGIVGVLVNIDSSCLESTPAHLRVEGKVAEARMLGELPVFIHHEMFEEITHCDSMDPWS